MITTMPTDQNGPPPRVEVITSVQRRRRWPTAEKRRLIEQVKRSANTDQSMDWLKPFMTKRTYKKGRVLFRKGDRAHQMFYVVTGKFLVSEHGVIIPAGHFFG